MKKITLSTLVLTALFGSNVHADNTITFMGEVAEQTCEVAINGATGSPTVLLPTVAVADLSSAGAVAGSTDFTLSVSGCTVQTVDPTIIKAVFVGNNVTLDGNYLANTGTATNVALQLLSSGNPIDVTGQGEVVMILPLNESSVSSDITVQYYAQGAATPGTVLSSVQYAVSYQ